MIRPVLGTAVDGGAVVQIDLQRLLVSRLLIQANSGAGKSWALRRLLEQTHAHVPQVVLDIDEEFHTLREKFPYVLAGISGADCRADVKTAPLLARRILEHGFSSIISIYELKAHERMRFVRVFLEALIAAPRSLWRPLLVVVDEAHIFCPEKGQAESAAAVADLMTRGRKRGYCGVLATQRISKLHKDAAAEANNKLIGRAALDLDMKRAADELGFTGREQQHQLRTLPPGRFFAFGPALSDTVIEVHVGKVHTTHPEPGDRGNLAPPPAPAKMKAILAKLADLPKEAEEQEGELERLRREVGELRRTAAAAGDPRIREESAAQAISEALLSGREQIARATVQQLSDIAEALSGSKNIIIDALNTVANDIERGKAAFAAEQQPEIRNLSSPIHGKLAGDGVLILDRAPPKGSRVTAAFKPSRPQEGADVHLQVSAPQQRILDALAWLEGVRIDQADRVQLALLADASPKSSGYTNNLGALRSAGLIDYPSTGCVALTDDGRKAARVPASPPTTLALHATLANKLPGPQWRILRSLIEVYPGDLSRPELAAAAEQSPSSSGYTNNLGALRSLGFLDYPATGRVVARPVLFLEG